MKDAGRKIANLYRDKGLSGLKQVLIRRRKRYSSAAAISWVRISLLKEYIVENVRLKQPPILILSMPRSGSSWLGKTLGSALNAAYLREPVSRIHMAEGGNVVFRFEPSSAPVAYRKASHMAFRGIPTFPEDVVVFPEQWFPIGRRQRHLIIKEVNPFASAWYTQLYRPFVILLVRHPAGVAQSFRRLNWWPEVPAELFFEHHGKYQGEALDHAHRVLEAYGEYKTVLYEDLCESPYAVFRDLFNLCDLTWDSSVENAVAQSIAGGDRAPHWTTNRDSKAMIHSWRQEISKEELKQLKDSFGQFGLPWYRDSQHWQ